MAFVVVGYVVMAQELDGRGKLKREKPISQRFTARSAAEMFRDLAKKGPFPDAFVREVMKHDDL